MDDLVLSVEVHDAPDTGSPQGSNLPELAVLLSLEPEGVPSLAGLPHSEEGYELQVLDSRITVRATCAHGLFNGAISLLQLLPSCAPMTGEIRLDCLEASPLLHSVGVLHAALHVACMQL